jgi:uncharacterized membrane protein YfcA
VTFLLLLVTALVGGAANALAGGGTFLVFPALLLAGVASVKANATASLILVPGAITSAWVYRRTLDGQSPRLIAQLVIASLVGSALGSILLLRTPNTTFSNLVPWLLLIAAVVFSLAPRLRSAAVRAAGHPASGHRSTAGLLIGQFLIAVYGGYFGAGMGVLMIALYLVTSDLDVQAANGIRLVAGSAINVLAVILFAARGALDFRFGLPMLIAGVVGGYFGARIMRRLKEKSVRNAILVYAWGLTAYFFLRLFLQRA